MTFRVNAKTNRQPVIDLRIFREIHHIITAPGPGHRECVECDISRRSITRPYYGMVLLFFAECVS